MPAAEDLVIHKIFSNTASLSPANIALQIKKDNQWKRISYQELESLSLKVATFLIKAGFKKGGYVALVLENRPEWPIIYLGIMYAGLACVPLDPQLSAAEIKNLILDSNAKAIFCSYDIFTKKIGADLRELLTKIIVLDAQVLQGKDFISFSGIESELLTKTDFPVIQPEDTASLIYTSGTTDTPKGVLLTHKNICSNFKSIEQLNICFSSDNFLCLLPLYHTYAFMVTLIAPLFLGAKITYCASGFKPEELSLIIKEAKVTILAGVPQLLFLIHKTIFAKIKKIPSFLRTLILPFIKCKLRSKLGRSLRLLVSGGARLDPKVAGDLSKFGFTIIEGYGLTETSPIATLNPLQKIKFGSVGKPIPGVQIMIFNPDKSGTGEVLIKGPNVMAGYFKQPELTARVIKDGWFYSADLGYLDKKGYLYLAGRKNDVIILSSGKNIYPEELEEYYSASHYIKEMCILPKSEERFGRFFDSLYAVVVPNLEYFRLKNESDIRGKIRWELENLSKGLAPYKHIMGFMLAKEELPRTVLKKIKRYAVAKKYLEKKIPEADIKETVFSTAGQKNLDQDIAKKIMRYICAELNKPVYLDSHLEIDLGIDSLSRVELALGLEAIFSVKIPDEALYSASTIKEIIIRLSEIIGKAKPLLEGEKEAPKTWLQILSEPPNKETLIKIRLAPNFFDKVFTSIFKNLFLLIFRIFWSLKIKGREFLPAGGPYLICPNHASFLDGLVVSSSLPLDCLMNTFFLGYSDIFEHPLVRWAIKSGRLIPLDPNTNLTKAMQAVSFVLQHKKTVCIFPEGRRSIDENPGEFKKGVGILIKELDIPTVPVYIKGSHKSWPRTALLPRFYPLEIIFGRPVCWQELQKQGKLDSRDDYEAIARALREEVLRLAAG